MVSAFAAGAIVVVALLYFHRPEGQFFYPRCTFHATTGLLCPGCGGLRSVHALLHGRLLEAVRSNALFVAGGPLVALGWAWARWRSGGRPVVTSRVVWGLMLVALVFTVARNLPWGPVAGWLSP